MFVISFIARILLLKCTFVQDTLFLLFRIVLYGIFCIQFYLVWIYNSLISQCKGFILLINLTEIRTVFSMRSTIPRGDALALLLKHNKEPFHILHRLTVEGVMRWFVSRQGYEDEIEYWGIVGLLHDIDFEEYPKEHCIKVPESLKSGSVGEDVIHAVCSHGYHLTVNIKPEHEMEKILYAVDESTGLIGAVVFMRSSKSVCDMELKSLKKI